MKRSLLDPLPRQLSTPALAALVALVVLGTGVAVARFLESAATKVEAAPASQVLPRVEGRVPGPDPGQPAGPWRELSGGARRSGPAYSTGASWTEALRGCSGGATPSSEPAPAAYRPGADGA
ncbi:MAG: hypothetical protein JNK02_04925 [Planctomycetes bacterium]|nr:hypothetical protein [Planctomycetota bacterium]